MRIVLEKCLMFFQIILVDDASERTYLKEELDEAIAKLDRVQILRNPTRTGLVGARLMGAKQATGDVLVFLDAHCEVSTKYDMDSHFNTSRAEYSNVIDFSIVDFGVRYVIHALY